MQSSCTVITLYIHDTTWLLHLQKYNFFICNYWHMKRKPGVLQFLPSFKISLEIRHNQNKPLAVTPHVLGSYRRTCGATKYALLYIYNFTSVPVHFCCYVSCQTVRVLCYCFPSQPPFSKPPKRQKSSQLASVSLNGQSCFAIFCFLPSRRQSTFYRSA